MRKRSFCCQFIPTPREKTRILVIFGRPLWLTQLHSGYVRGVILKLFLSSYSTLKNLTRWCEKSHLVANLYHYFKKWLFKALSFAPPSGRHRARSYKFLPSKWSSALSFWVNSKKLTRPLWERPFFGQFYTNISVIKTEFWSLVEWQWFWKVIYFEKNLLQQSDVVFDSESNERNLSSLVPLDGEKKIIFSIFFTKWRHLKAWVFLLFFFCSNGSLKKYYN